MDESIRPEAASSMGDLFALRHSASHQPSIMMETLARMRAEQLSPIDEGEEVESEIGTIKVIVKIVGETEGDLELFLSDYSTVWDLKNQISEKLAAGSRKDVPIHRQRLIFAGKMLEDDDFLVDDVNMKLDFPNHVHLAPIPSSKTIPPKHRMERASPVYSDEESLPSPYTRRLRSRELRRSQVSPYGGSPTTTGRRPSALLRRYLETFADADEEDQPPLTTRNVPLVDTSRHAADIRVSPPFVSPVQPTVVCRREPSLVADAASQLTLADSVAHSLDQVSQTSLSSVAPHLSSVDVARVLGVHGPSVDTNTVVERNALVLSSDLLPRCRTLQQQLSRFLAPYPTMQTTELQDTAALLELVAHQGLQLASSLRQVAVARQQQQTAVAAQHQASSLAFAHRQSDALQSYISRETASEPLNPYLRQIRQTYNIYPSDYL